MTQYQSIYRKWRPQFFEDIVGQNHITQTLMNAIKLNRIGHAYIFSGPRGVGKTTTARILAKALNCQEGPTDHPCNKCSQCTRINNGQSMDVVEIDGASNRGIDEIRELRSKIGFAAVEGKYKVYIIDEVHMLTNEAFNALLKTLEEPPSQVLFIFATTSPQKVPNTILSRCQCFNFRRISNNEIVSKLKKIIEKEEINIDLPSLSLIAESATGSMRDAESILDQIIAFGGKKISHEDVKEILGIIPKKIFFELASAISKHKTELGISIIDKILKEGIDLHQFVQDFIVYIHQLSLIKILGKEIANSTLLEENSSEQVLDLITTIDIKTMMDMIDELSKIEDKIKHHHYPWILLELLVVKLTQEINRNMQTENTGSFENMEDNKETNNLPIKKIPAQDEVSKKKETLVRNINKESTDNKSEDINQTKVEFDKIWLKLLTRIKREKISLYAFLTANSEAYLEGNKLMMGFHNDCLFHKESLEKRENREKVEAVIKEESDIEINLNCFISEKVNKKGRNIIKNKDSISHEPKKSDMSKGPKEQVQGENLSDNVILEKARDLFGGNIVED